jgi:hypothetical protein
MEEIGKRFKSFQWERRVVGIDERLERSYRAHEKQRVPEFENNLIGSVTQGSWILFAKAILLRKS